MSKGAKISIHALVKRATASKKLITTAVDISIHALVKRATRGCNFLRAQGRYFNPRPREEGDGTSSGSTSGTDISIHALVKRAT